MDSTMIIVKILAIYFIVSGLALIFKKKTFALVIKDLFAHPSITFLAGVMLVFLGGFLVFTHNVWDTNLDIFVAGVSWIILIKGIAYILIPEVLAKMVTKYL